MFINTPPNFDMDHQQTRRREVYTFWTRILTKFAIDPLNIFRIELTMAVRVCTSFWYSRDQIVRIMIIIVYLCHLMHSFIQRRNRRDAMIRNYNCDMFDDNDN